MAEVHHFSQGWITPTIALVVSFLGSLLGLTATSWARSATERWRRTLLLLFAAWAIGGTGIWVMHFVAMIGFSVSNAELVYDVGLTIASFVIAVAMVGIGLFLVGYGQPTLAKLLVGGPVTGVGVAFMHYTGMDAMRIPFETSYNRPLVIASYAIAVVAATVALWFTVVARSPSTTVAASLLMAVAVAGMHYTGMAAIEVSPRQHPVEDGGQNVTWFLPPIAMFSIIMVAGLIAVIRALPSARDDEDAVRGGQLVAPRRAAAEDILGQAALERFMSRLLPAGRA